MGERRDAGRAGSRARNHGAPRPDARAAPRSADGAPDARAAPRSDDGAPRLQTDGESVLRRLSLLPGGPELLDLARDREDVELIGGAVRDLMLGRAPREMDVVLDGEPGSFPHSSALFARDLADRLPDGSEVSFHQRFGTAAVHWRGQRIDIAARRRETYPEPGALPQVAPGTPEEDLLRRDFAVNAIAVGLGGGARARVRHVHRAIDDLHAGKLRVLHDGSFLDDPTRLMRLARYAARLGFEVEEGTARLASLAIERGALATVSGARVGAELRLAATESDPAASLAALQRLGVLRALDQRMQLDEQMLRDALELLPADGRPDLLALAAAMTPVAVPAEAPTGAPDAPTGAPDTSTGAPDAGLDAKDLLDLLERWECPAADRAPIVEAAGRAGVLAAQMPRAGAPSQLWELLRRAPPEAVALAGAIGARQGDAECRHAAVRWLSELRHVRLRITGDDLLSAGLSPGPEIGARLEDVLRMRLDGAIEDGREAELRAALDAWHGAGRVSSTTGASRA